MTESNVIKFWKVNDTYGCFSNFSKHGFDLDGFWWQTSEHYFQANKFTNTDKVWFDKIRESKTPKDAADMGRDRSHKIHRDWEKVKDEIMLQAVLTKFKTHDDIHKILLSTGDNKIIEDSPMDYYWGCGADGTGRNTLGYILMEVREILRDKNKG